MAYGADVVELTLDNYFKDGRRERTLLWQGDPIYEMFYDRMQRLPQDNGTTFSFDVKYGSKARYTAGGTGLANVGTGNTYARGSDARAKVIAMWADENIDLDALAVAGQIPSYIEDEIFGEMIAAQQPLAEKLLTGATPTDADSGFAQFFTLHGGDDTTAVTYTALDGVSRNGLLYHAPTATQITNGITRHGISSAEANTWVNQYEADGATASWAADTQIDAAKKLYRACSRGARQYGSGSSVTYQKPTMGICSSSGYDQYLKWLKGNVRYIKGGDTGSDTMQNVLGGVMFDEKCPLYYSYSIDDALTTQFTSGGTAYGGVLWFLYAPAFRVRYGGRPGSKNQKGRVWRARAIDPDVEPTRDRQLFKMESEQQFVCLHLPSQGCMKGWDRA